MAELLFDKEGSVGIVTLNRPEKKNAFSFEMVHGLLDYFNKAELDDSIRAIVMTGTGKSFCSGADLSGRGGRKDVDTPVGMKISALAYGRVFFAMATLEKPIITAVNGLAAKASREMAAGDIIEIRYPDRDLLVEVIEVPGGQVPRKDRERYYRVMRETRYPRGGEFGL